MLACEDFGRRHQGCLRAALDRVQHGEEGDERLSGADIALQHAQHALAGGHVGEDLVQRLVLAAGEAELEGGQCLGAQDAIAFQRAAADLTHAGARQIEGELAGQQLVISEAAAGGCLRVDVGERAWRMDGLDRRVPVRPGLLLQPGGVLPFLQHRDPVDGVCDGAGECFLRQAFGAGIDGLELRGGLEGFLVHHGVGMRHLQAAVIAFDLATHVAQLADGQQVLQIIAMALEEDEVDVTGRVTRHDLVGQAGAA